MTREAITRLLARIDLGADDPAATLADIRKSLQREAHDTPSLKALRCDVEDAAWGYGQEYGAPVCPDDVARALASQVLQRLDDHALAELVIQDEALYDDCAMSSLFVQDSVADVLSANLQSLAREALSDSVQERGAMAPDSGQSPPR